TISPGLTSLMNSPPTASNAQLSEARIYELSNFPIAKGLMRQANVLLSSIRLKLILLLVYLIQA
ncbi:MAG TPA: hypothetical protein VHT34_03755, partial [Clostridia bacterium]|nr:hypothetical protein [Clostridia bacterium]